MDFEHGLPEVGCPYQTPDPCRRNPADATVGSPKCQCPNTSHIESLVKQLLNLLLDGFSKY